MTFVRPPAQLDVISGTSFFGIREGHVKQKIGDFNITGESEMEFIFRTFLRTAFITSVLNGQVSRKCMLLAIEWPSYCVMKQGKGRTIGQFRILKIGLEQELDWNRLLWKIICIPHIRVYSMLVPVQPAAELKQAWNRAGVGMRNWPIVTYLS